MNALPLVFAAIAAGSAIAGPIQIEDTQFYVHDSSGLVVQQDASAGSYFSNLNADNEGTFGWSFTNTTAGTLYNVLLFGFLDADIDRDTNTFFNEYGQFIDLSLPPSAIAGSIAASSWQIDEPGFVFGTILNDLLAGSLTNTNNVTSSFPDDVSLALGFAIGNLTPGQTAKLTLQISPSPIGGLRQIDPDSDTGFYFNGYATLLDSEVPEPATWLFCACGLTAVLFLRKR